MTASIDKNASIHSEPYLYSEPSHSYEIEKIRSVPDRMGFSDSSHYLSYLDRLFQKHITPQTFIEPPWIAPVLERRLFLLDLIRDFANLGSYWESLPKKLDNLPDNVPTGEMRKLFEIMANLSQISRDISNKRYQFQKG